MKLKDWADKQGISYLTAWRWFKAGDPRLADAYQSDSGTIIVPDEFDATEQSMNNTIQTNDIMSSILKKTVELSKNNGSIEDFAAWILSNFNLRPYTMYEGPKYSRNKPKSEEVQKHFQKFIKPKGEKPKPNMFVAEADALDELIAQADNMTTQDLVNEIQKVGGEGMPINLKDTPEMEDLMKDLSSALNSNTPIISSTSVVTYGDAEGLIARSVELTPQSLNYTGSSDSTFSTNSLPTASSYANFQSMDSLRDEDFEQEMALKSFRLTQKELDSVSKISALADKPKRGRKSKNIGKKL